MAKDIVDRILSYDPLLEAEKLTGKSYKEDEETSGLGFLLMQEHSKNKEAILQEQADSHNRMDHEEYVKLLSSLGFDQVFQLDFLDHDRGNDEERHQNSFEIWYDPEGVLLTFDTFSWGDYASLPHNIRNKRTINGSSFYYNWRPNDDVEDYYRYTSSGGFNAEAYDAGDKIWCGNHDGREAIKHKLSGLRRNGTFVKPWIEPQFILLGHYCDKYERSKYKYPKSIPYKEMNVLADEINKERLALLPKEVQETIRLQEWSRNG